MTDPVRLPHAQFPEPGGRIDPERPFLPVRAAVVAISDTRTLETDTSGALLAQMIRDDGHLVTSRHVVRDDIEAIRSAISGLIDSGEADAIITTGGTGITGRDVTPEAVGPMLDKRLDGFAVIFHMLSYQSVGLSTLQSRALAGICRGVFVFCLPGSKGACRDGWEKVIRWQLDSRHLPCNLVELMPRLREHLPHDGGH